MFSIRINNILLLKFFYQILNQNVKLDEVQFMRKLIFCESMNIASFQIHIFFNNSSHQSRRYSLLRHHISKL